MIASHRMISRDWRQAGALLLHLAAVNLGDDATLADDRKHDAAVQVLVPALAVDPEPLQPLADRGTGDPVFLGQPQPERAIGEAELERGDRFLAPEPAFFQVVERGGRLLQPLVIVVDDLAQQCLVVGVEGDGRRQLRHARLFCRCRGRDQDRGLAVAQHLDGVPEREAVVPHEEVDHAAARPAAEAVEEVLARRDDEAGRLVVVEGIAAGQVPAAVGFQLDALGADQGREVRLPLDPLQLGVGDPRHARPPLILGRQEGFALAMRV